MLNAAVHWMALANQADRDRARRDLQDTNQVPEQRAVG
jgi:hypothetical protein